MHSSTPAYCPNCGSTRGYYARSGKCTDCGVAGLIGGLLLYSVVNRNKILATA